MQDNRIRDDDIANIGLISSCHPSIRVGVLKEVLWIAQFALQVLWKFLSPNPHVRQLVFFASHICQDSLSGGGERVNGHGIAVVEPKSYRRFQLGCSRQLFGNYNSFRYSCGHTSLFSITYAVPFAVSTYTVPLPRMYATISIISFPTSAFA